MNLSCDVLVGLQHGDEGKGKVTKCFAETGNYNYCVRFNGGPNAGHTIYFDGKKVVTHQIPTGIFYNMNCLIGTGCVIDIDKLKKEITYINECGIDVSKYLKISKYAHIITKEHLEDDIINDKIGSTKNGIRPAYRDKYDRKGLRMGSFCNKILGCEVVDPYEVLNKDGNYILFEGAQGFELDVDSPNYPYVTSSHCLVGHINTCGVSVKTINDIIGIIKIYDTYVGNKEFQNNDPDILELGKIGEEFGSTTGRRRQCNWLNISSLIKAIRINGVNILIINKCDIIKKLDIYKLYYDGKLLSFHSFELMEIFINKTLNELFPKLKIIYSQSKDTI